MTLTGRTRGGPVVQNIPVRTKEGAAIREAFMASQPCKNGGVEVAADGSCLRCGADQGVACRDKVLS